MASMLAFATDALKFEEHFKGIKTHICTLKLNFRLPIIREVALAGGAVAASKRSLNWILSNPEKGNSATLIVGGAAEALYTEPGSYKICLKKRKGFCRVALQNGWVAFVCNKWANEHYHWCFKKHNRSLEKERA